MTATIHSEKSSIQESYLKLFQEVTHLLTSTLNVDRVLNLIVQKIPDVMGVHAATVRLLDPSGKKLRLLASHGLSQTYLNRGPVDAEKSVITALTGEPVAVYDAATDPCIHYSEHARTEGVKSILVTPIMFQGKVKGILRLISRTPRRFEREEMAFAKALAQQCGIAIRNATSYKKIMDLATDLERHEQFLQSIFDGLKADLFVIDPNYRIVMVNKVFLKNHAMEESQVIGHRFDKILRIGKSSEKLLQRLKRGDKTVAFTKKVVEKTGEAYLEVMATPMYRQDNREEVDFIIGTIRDVSDHIRLKKELRAKERLQGVIEMAGAVAHEVNNPLAIVLATSHLLKKEMEPTARSSEDLDIITRNLERIADLIRKMTHITEYQAEKYIHGINIIDIEKASKT